MATKKYVLNRLYELVASFRTPKGKKVVTFGNGSRYHERKGYFITSDVELQKAIESSKLFGKEFYLESTEEDATEEKAEEKVEEVAEVVAPTTKTYEEYLTNPEEVVRETTVTTLQKAKMWLQATHGKTFKGVTKDDIRKEAAEKYNTLFENWD